MLKPLGKCRQCDNVPGACIIHGCPNQGLPGPSPWVKTKCAHHAGVA